MSAPNPGVLGLEPSFGYGDRLGTATPGHLEAHRGRGDGIAPIFAQQSIREMERTARSAEDVMGDAANALAAEGFTDPWGADADHLKTTADVDATAAAGYTFFTIDPSDHVDIAADDYSAAEVDEHFAGVRSEIDWLDTYRGQTVRFDGFEIVFDEATVRRAAVKYGRAIAHSLALAAHIKDAAAGIPGGHEIELSVDETPQPTTLAEHYVIADQCRRSGMNLVSLAPRYVGGFEKGIDYRGDLDVLERSLEQHMQVVRRLGPYKLSLHSGSDKLSIYPIIARVTGGLFHVKTAGTSYLEALRAVARHDPALLRRVVEFSRDRFETDRATYHISSELRDAAPSTEIDSASDLEDVYLDRDPGRQILHVTFGSVLTDPDFGPAIKALLDAEPATHQRVVADHFRRHLAALQEGL
jgi:tagaturonate epimerase